MTATLSRHALSTLGITPRAALVPALAAVVAGIAGLAWALENLPYDLWAAAWIAPVLLLLVVPLARHAARADGTPSLFAFLMAAAALKIVFGSVARYWMAFDLYGGDADAGRYHKAGKALAPAFRHLDYANLGKISGTRFMEVLTGQVYALTGPTRLGGFMVYSAMAFVGLYLFHRAFRTALPDGDHRRYRLLVFLFPSLVFWPSSIGKEAWMLLCLGAAVWGGAHVLNGRFGGIVAAGLGLWGMAIVRPHVALLVVLGLVAALVVRSLRSETGPRAERSRAAVLVAGVLAVVAAVAVISRVEAFFHLDRIDVNSAESVFTETERRTGQGGSEFDAPDATNPVGFLQAGFAVLLRPLPGEASSAQGLVASLEGLLLAALLVASVPRLARTPRRLTRSPLLAFAAVYAVGFVYAFSRIENFGILTRQRVQLLPVVFIWVRLRWSDGAFGLEPARLKPAWPGDPPVRSGVWVTLSVAEYRDRQELRCLVSHPGIDHWCCTAPSPRSGAAAARRRVGARPAIPTRARRSSTPRRAGPRP